MELKNDLLLRAAMGEEVERVPVWLMRQAGRILPQYRKVRQSVKDFKTLVSTPELAAEVTIQPVDELDVDAAIIFSDILVIPEALGLPYKMEEGEGPAFPQTIKTGADIQKLNSSGIEERLQYVFDAISLTKKELNGRVPLIGFAGAPWTILAYMVEGSGSKTFSNARAFLYKEPELAHELLQKITKATIAYLKAQVSSGVNLVQLFDSWAGILPPYDYKEFSIRYIKEICEAINEVPVIVFPKGAFFALRDFIDIPCQVIGLDWNMTAEYAKNILFNKTVQGNLDPCALYAKSSVQVEKTEAMLREFGLQNYIANLGHGVYPDTPLENVKLFVHTVKNYNW